MDQIQTHPSNAAQAKTFIAPGSLSFPGGAGELTPPSEAQNGQKQMNGSQVAQGHVGNGVAPATPAATPGTTAPTGVSGIVPTLQYVYPLSLI